MSESIWILKQKKIIQDVLIENKSSLFLSMAWSCQASSHYLNQGWQRPLMLFGVNRPQWVNFILLQCGWFIFSLPKLYEIARSLIIVVVLIFTIPMIIVLELGCIDGIFTDSNQFLIIMELTNIRCHWIHWNSISIIVFIISGFSVLNLKRCNSQWRKKIRWVLLSFPYITIDNSSAGMKS